MCELPVQGYLAELWLWKYANITSNNELPIHEEIY